MSADAIGRHLGFLSAVRQPAAVRMDYARSKVVDAEWHLASGGHHATELAQKALALLEGERDYRAPLLRQRAQAVIDAEAARA